MLCGLQHVFYVWRWDMSWDVKDKQSWPLGRSRVRCCDIRSVSCFVWLSIFSTCSPHLRESHLRWCFCFLKSWLFGSIVRSHSAATKWKGRQYFHSTYHGFPIWTRVNDWKSRFLFQKLPFPTMWEEETNPVKSVPTHFLIQISWRETGVIKVYMILKIFRIPFFTSEKNHLEKRHDKNILQYTSKTKLPLEVWRASDFYPTLFLDGLEAAAFGGALALERSANSMAKEIRLQLGIWSGNFYLGGMIWKHSLWSWGWIFVGFTVFSMSEMCWGGWSDFSHQL